MESSSIVRTSVVEKAGWTRAGVGSALLVFLLALLLSWLAHRRLDAVLARLAKRWAADDRIAVLVDSLTVKLVRA